MTRKTRLGDHGSQRIDQEVKQNRGEWVTLPHTSQIPEERSNLTIHIDRSLATRDQLK
jgi:hypothetical protein